MSSEMVAVTPEDRRAGAALMRCGRLSLKEMVAADMEEGRADDSDVVQAFARHRIAVRERCAKVAENFDPRGIMTQPAYDQCAAHGDDIAAAIRENAHVG